VADPREDITFVFDLPNGLQLRQAAPQLQLRCGTINYSGGRFTAYLADGQELEGSFERAITGGELPSVVAGRRQATTTRKTAPKKGVRKTAKKGARKASKKAAKPKRRR
jgi:hypothetical protein